MKKENLTKLKKGGVGIIKTDTIYGIVGSALNRKTVERIYEIKERNKKKPFIILISEKKDLEKFGVKVGDKLNRVLDKYWPGRVSIILNTKSLKYLHRGQESLAFRLPKFKGLIEILNKTGPLVAPSANPEGLPPAKTIKEAKRYFEEKIDFYEGGGVTKFKPSKLIKIQNNRVIALRK